jgi:hypothetical protein
MTERAVARADLPPTLDRDPERHLSQLWQQGQRPDVHRFLATAGPLSVAEVAPVLAVDQRQRWQQGERVPAEAYLQHHPVLQAEAERALELVYGEFLLREELGEAPVLAEYLQRFPQYAARLRQQVDLHRALAAGPTYIEPVAAAWGVLVMSIRPAEEDLQLLSRAAWEARARPDDRPAAGQLLHKYPDLWAVPA